MSGEKGRQQADPASLKDLGPAELKARAEAGEAIVLLDVREPFERDFCALPSPKRGLDLHIPMGSLAASLEEIREAASQGPLVIYCHHGVRSLMVGHWLVGQGISDVYNLDGGIDAFATEVDPTLPRY